MSTASTPLRIAIVEDQPLYRAMLASLLQNHEDLDVVVQAGDLASARRHIRTRDVDVAILDIELPDGDGFAYGRELRTADPSLGILLLSAIDAMDALLSLPPDARRGWSYLSKLSATSVSTLLRAIQASAEQRTMLDPALVDRSTPRSGTVVQRLTSRQMEALKLMASGLSNRGIAEELKISTHSVDNLINGLYAELGVSSEPNANRRVAAVLAFLESSARVQARGTR